MTRSTGFVTSMKLSCSVPPTRGMLLLQWQLLMLGWYRRRSRAALLRLSGFFTKVLWRTSANIHAKNRLMGSIPALVWTGDTALIYDTDYRIFYRITHLFFFIMCLSSLMERPHFCANSSRSSYLPCSLISPALWSG